MSYTKPNGRPWSELDQACDKYIRDYARLDPIAATDWGLPADPSTLPDLSPAGLEQKASLDRELLGLLPRITMQDRTDQITADALNDRLAISLELHDTAEDAAELNNLASPLQGVRDAFSLMPTDSRDDWEAIWGRMRAVPTALEQYAQALRYAASREMVAARRQVEIGVRQCAAIGDPDSPGAFFRMLADECPGPIRNSFPSSEVEGAVRAASEAYSRLGQWLRTDLLPHARENDPVGRDRYELFSAQFVGARVDLDDTYEWGLEELAQITAEQEAIATQLYGSGTPVSEAFKRLDADPKYQVSGEDALLSWLQRTADTAIADLNGTQFDIPAPIQTIQARIAPSKDGGVWYTGPSADFARPGRMWWSIPEGEHVFHTWQERTTVFHEGVPGHHLQIAQAIYESASLNLWRRLGSWNSGHGEGWALYAEELMAELGYQDDPGDRMGLLDGQRLRAARVVLDIGVHLGKPRPDGRGTWDAEYAWGFLRDNVAMSEGNLRFELDRYLGWPGQAPSYKIGQRLWRQLRDDYLAAKVGCGEDDRQALARQFHSVALAQGSLPMDTLRKAVLGQ